MKPVTHPEENVVYKGPTPDIGDLSCYRPKPGLILSEWDLTIAERLALMRGARVELGISTEPIPPVSLAIVKRPGSGDEALEYVEPHGPYRAVEPGDLEAQQVRAAVDALGLTFNGRSRDVTAERYKVTHCGWFAFEGFGRPFEAWSNVGGWRSHGRAFTWRGARRKATRAAISHSLPEEQP